MSASITCNSALIFTDVKLVDLFPLSWTIVPAQGEGLETILVDKLSEYRKNRRSFESGDVISQGQK